MASGTRELRLVVTGRDEAEDQKGGGHRDERADGADRHDLPVSEA